MPIIRFGVSIQCFAALMLVLATSRAPGQQSSTQPTSEPSGSFEQPTGHLNTRLVPPRPAPPIEIGNPFFGPGPQEKGFELPTGAVWTPSLILFGTYRTAFQAFHDPLTESGPLGHPYGDKTRAEWANRLDLFANLQLSGTERVLLGFRPFDNGMFARPALAKYTGYQFSPSGTDGFVYKFSAVPTTAFFEGDIGQIFPMLDPRGNLQSDIGFSVGRQPLLYQDGLLIDDDVDAVGVTRNSILPQGGSNEQITVLYGWNQINRGDGINHNEHALLGLFIDSDFRPSTWDLDLVYVNGRGADPDGLFGGLSATQRFGELNSTFRVLGSKALGRPSPGPSSAFSAYGNGSTAVGNGVLLFSELSFTPGGTNDLVYLDPYWCIHRFTSAARGPDRGGTLGRVGILFAEQPIGRYGSALSSNPARSAGFALGYQKFLDPDRRQQLILELGGREHTGDTGAGALATGARYQRAFGQHTVLQLDAFVALNEGEGLGYGARAELRFEF